jgi:hypothetical protein
MGVKVLSYSDDHQHNSVFFFENSITLFCSQSNGRSKIDFSFGLLGMRRLLGHKPTTISNLASATGRLRRVRSPRRRR